MNRSSTLESLIAEATTYNDDHSRYVRSETVDDRLRHVLMDADGPGAIVRFWSTTNQVKQGRLRVVLDGAAAPALEFPAFDLLSGGLPVGAPWITAHPGYAPRGGGGATCYLPIPYARHCLVTWEDADPAQVGPRCYQIDYRTYAPGTPVATFTAAACAAAQEAITRGGHRLGAPPDYGLVRLSVAHGAETTPFDGFAAGVEPSGAIALGTATPHEGRILLRVEFAGRNQRTTGDGLLMGLDCVVLTPTDRRHGVRTPLAGGASGEIAAPAGYRLVDATTPIGP